MRALVIDDSRAMRALLGRILRDLGYEVTDAADGRDGLARLRALGTADLVLVDWGMPVMDGLEFVRALRADPALAGVRVLMVSTETEAGQVARALAAGVDEYVMKPFTRDTIVGKLELLGLAA